MATAVVKDNHLTYNGKAYFRGGAEDVLLGSYGEKKTPLTKANYLEVQRTLPANKFKIRSVTIATIDWTNSVSFSLGASAVVSGLVNGVPVKASATGNLQADFSNTGHLRLVKIIVEAAVMKDAINATASSLAEFRGYGSDARVCHELWVVLEATLAQALSTSTSFTASASATVEGFELTGTVTAAGGTKSTSKVTISKGSSFAYLLAQADWNKSGLKKTTIKKLSDDQWSLN